MKQTKGLFNAIAVVLLICVSSTALAVVEVKEFSSDQLRERFQVLVTELRCPKCQNQNLADSNSPISADLRNEIFRMLEEGKSDQEITNFLVVRYGEFVMYRPPVKKTTLVLWLTPGVLVLIGIIILAVIRRRQASSVGKGSGAIPNANKSTPNKSFALASDEQEQFDQLLGKTQSQGVNVPDPEPEVETGVEPVIETGTDATIESSEEKS